MVRKGLIRGKISTMAKQKTDWEKIEREFRAGILSLREIGDANGVSHVAVSKRAKAEGWPRDLKAKIQAKADAMVNKALVNADVNKARESETVEAGAKAVVEVRLRHRRDIARAQTFCGTLMGELENASPTAEQGAESPRQVMPLPARIDSMKKLSETLKVLVGLEREAYGIEEVSRFEHTGPDGAPLPAAPSIIVLKAPDNVV